MEQSAITLVTPEQLGYKDRGMLKWFGMMLSDHSEALNKERMDGQSLNIKPKDNMADKEISNILYKAFVKNSPVLIQANVIKNGNHYKDLECKVLGSNDNRIYFQLINQQTFSCTLDEIRNVEFMNIIDWYNKLE